MINTDSGFYQKHPAVAELEIVSWVFIGNNQVQGGGKATMLVSIPRMGRLLLYNPCLGKELCVA